MATGGTLDYRIAILLTAASSALLAACAGSDPGAAPANAGGQATANPTLAATQPAATPTAEPTATRIPLPTRRPATPAPRLSLQSRIPIRELPLTLFSGETLRLSDLQGQVVVVNFWASWCGPCVTEMPAFERVYNEYSDRGVTFLGIDFQDVELSARAFAERIGVTYPLATDETGRLAVEFELIEANGVFSLPSTVFLDRNGRPVRKFAGAMSESVLRGIIEVILDQG